MMKITQLLLTASVGLLVLVSTAAAQTTAFTYQGKLTDSGNLANGNYDLQFKLFDTATVGTGTQQGSTVAVSNVTISNGIFTVQLDFGACPTCFNGAARFLEIAIQPTSGGSFTTLTPRQPITSTPYALNAAQLGGLAANGFLQNSTSQQTSSNFNISGDGTAGGTLSANFLNATTRYNLNGQTVLSALGSQNLFVGINAGTNNTGSNNAFFGSQAGQANTSGSQNAFFGSLAGQANTGGQRNAFFGRNAGTANTTGFDNAIFGAFAGEATTIGGANAFFGSNAGIKNTSGSANTFIGKSADFDVANPTGDNNTLLGALSKVTSGISNATAIGFRAQVTQSNALVLGSIIGVNGGTDTTVGIGTTAPAALLDVQRDGGTIAETARFTTYGTNNEILSRASGGNRAAPAATPNGRFLLQLGATGHDGTAFVANPAASIMMDTAEAWTSTAQGTQMRFRTTANGTTASAIATRMLITNDGKVGIGTSAPQFPLHVVGDINTTTQYDIGGLRSFTVNGPFNNGTTIFTASNTFVGDGAGVSTMPSSTLNDPIGKFNSFFGAGAGQANTFGSENAFFGTQAGKANTTGTRNAFFGYQAGFLNTTGISNAIFGYLAGFNNTTGSSNAFFGTQAGQANSTGTRNAFFGFQAGLSNTTGSNNAFFGHQAGQQNTGDDNAFFGHQAGQANTTGNFNAFFGHQAGLANTTGSENAFFGYLAGVSNTTGIFNTFLGRSAGEENTTGQLNTFIGYSAGIGVSDGGLNTTLGANARVTSGISNATAIGANAQVTQSDSLVLGSNNGIVKVGIGNSAPLDKLHVSGDIRIGTGTTGCVKDANGTVIAGTCSSDARLKRAIVPFAHLLDKLAQLQPVQFYWRADEFKERHFGTKPSFGLIAQEVEKVMPELVSEDEQGYKAVNYSKLPLLTLQAIKELKQENDTLKQN